LKSFYAVIFAAFALAPSTALPVEFPPCDVVSNSGLKCLQDNLNLVNKALEKTTTAFNKAIAELKTVQGKAILDGEAIRIQKLPFARQLISNFSCLYQ
jgi:hypothetical protein